MKKLQSFAVSPAIRTINPAASYFLEASLDLVNGSTNSQSAAHKEIRESLRTLTVLSPSFIRDSITKLVQSLALLYGAADTKQANEVIALCVREGDINIFPELTKKLANRTPRTVETAVLVDRYCQSPGVYPDSAERTLEKLIRIVGERNAKDAKTMRNKLQQVLDGPRILIKRR